MTRMFVAATPSVGAVQDLDDFLAVRRSAGEFRWTLPDQWHITLAFSEQVPDRALDDVVARLTRAAKKRRSFATRIVGGGAFPNVARARVLYAGLESAEPATIELSRLATGARAALGKAGAPVAGARFHPHLTVARLGRPAEVTNWVRLLDSYRGPDWFLDSISLVASHLGEGPRKRPRHELVETFLLGSSLDP